MDINERFALWEKKYKPHGEHEELLYIIAKDAVAALSSPHPEAREEDKETTAEIRQLVGKLDDGHWPSMVLEQIEGQIKGIVEHALSRLAAPKPEGLRKALEEAAQSLEALAGLAGKDETMLEYDQVRGYALNRAMAARAALRESDGRKGE